MKKSKLILTGLFIALTMLFTACNNNDDGTIAPSNIEKATAILQAIQTGNVTAMQNYVNQTSYTQHNLSFPDGIASVIGTIQSGGLNGTTVNTIRSFEDGNIVVLHSIYGGTWNGGTPQVAFDVFRFENGLAVEHWDNLQDVADPVIDSVNGHTQTDGAMLGNGDIATNKAVISSFAENVLVGGSWITAAPNYFTANGDYIQHSVGTPNGIAWFSPFGDSFQYYNSESPKYIYGAGDFVLIMSQGNAAVGFGDTAFYDLFRLKEGKIIEHWDTQQQIPPKANWANSNGKW